MSYSKLLCNVSTNEYFRLVDDMAAPVWVRTNNTVMISGKKLYGCHLQNGKETEFVPAGKRVYLAGLEIKEC